MSFATAFFPPWVTLWAFLAQVLAADSSCRQTLGRVIAHCLHHNQTPPSPNTAAYCRARKRLTEDLLARLVRQSGQALQAQAQAHPQALWRGLRLFAVDGTTVSMPDTPQNQSAYPQPSSQASGCGFPILRLVALFGLFTGALLDFASGSLHASEMSLFRQLLPRLRDGDLLLGDRYYGVFGVLATLLENRAHGLFRIAASRITDFRRGVRLGPDDHLIAWHRPKVCPRGLALGQGLREDILQKILRLRPIQGGLA